MRSAPMALLVLLSMADAWSGQAFPGCTENGKAASPSSGLPMHPNLVNCGVESFAPVAPGGTRRFSREVSRHVLHEIRNNPDPMGIHARLRCLEGQPCPPGLTPEKIVREADQRYRAMRLHLMSSQSRTSINVGGSYANGSASRLQMTWGCPEGKLNFDSCVHQGGAWTHEVGNGHAYRHGFERIFGIDMTEAARIPDPQPWDVSSIQDDAWQTIWHAVNPRDWARYGITAPPNSFSAEHDGRVEDITRPTGWRNVPTTLGPALRELSKNSCVAQNVNRALSESRERHRASYFNLIHHNTFLPYAVGNARGELTRANLINAYKKVIENTNETERRIWDEGLTHEELRVFAPAAANLIKGYRGCAETLCPEANRWLAGLPENQRAALGFAPKEQDTLAQVLQQSVANMPQQILTTVGDFAVDEASNALQGAIGAALGGFAAHQIMEAADLGVQFGGVMIDMTKANEMTRLGLTTMAHDLRSTSLLGAIDDQTEAQLKEFIRSLKPDLMNAGMGAATAAAIDGFTKSTPGLKIREMMEDKMKETPVFNLLKSTRERLTGRSWTTPQMIEFIEDTAEGLTERAITMAVSTSQGAFGAVQDLQPPPPPSCLPTLTPQVTPAPGSAQDR